MVEPELDDFPSNSPTITSTNPGARDNRGGRGRVAIPIRPYKPPSIL